MNDYVLAGKRMYPVIYYPPLSTYDKTKAFFHECIFCNVIECIRVCLCVCVCGKTKTFCH